MTAVARVPGPGLTSVPPSRLRGVVSATGRARDSRRARKLLGRRVFFALTPPPALSTECRAAALRASCKSLSHFPAISPKEQPLLLAPPPPLLLPLSSSPALLFPDGAWAQPPPLLPRALNPADPAGERYRPARGRTRRTPRPGAAEGAGRGLRERESAALRGYLASGGVDHGFEGHGQRRQHHPAH